MDLKKPPVDVQGVLGAQNPLGGILGATLGESAEEAQARVEEAKKGATDLSGLVRKKEKRPEAAEAIAEANSKRKADGPADGAEETKKAKVDRAAPTASS